MTIQERRRHSRAIRADAPAGDPGWPEELPKEDVDARAKRLVSISTAERQRGTLLNMASQRSRSATVSEKDREYFRRLGAWEEENWRDDWARCKAMTFEERLARSWGVTQRHRASISRWPDQLPEEDILARAKRLGLYRYRRT